MENLLEHLEKLPAIACIAEMGSYGQAAKRLRVSQPALSLMVKSLEEQLGTQLFHRSHQGVRLTVDGEKLLALTRRLEQQVRDFSFSVERDRSPVKIASYDCIVELLVRIAAQLPDFSQLKLQVANSGRTLLDSLVQREVDYVVVAEPLAVKDVVIEQLIVGSYHLYAPTDWRTRWQVETLSEALHLYPLIYLPGSVSHTHGTIDRMLRHEQLHSWQSVQVNSYVIARQLVANGLGIGLLVDTLVNAAKDNSVERIDYFSDATRLARTHIYLAYRRGTEETPSHRDIRKFIGKVFDTTSKSSRNMS